MTTQTSTFNKRDKTSGHGHALACRTPDLWQGAQEGVRPPHARMAGALVKIRGKQRVHYTQASIVAATTYRNCTSVALVVGI